MYSLAIMSTALFLEGYANAFVEEYVPEHLREAYLRLTVPQRLKLLPRFSSKQSTDVDSWEKRDLHDVIKGIFEKRNKLAHGKVGKIKARNVRKKTVAEYWNTALDTILLLEINWLSRVPRSRQDDFKREVDELRV